MPKHQGWEGGSFEISPLDPEAAVHQMLNQAYSMHNLQSEKHIPKFLKIFANLFPVENTSKQEFHRSRTPQSSRFLRRGYTQCTQHTGLKSTHTHTHTLTQHVANACVQIKPIPPTTPFTTIHGLWQERKGRGK